MAGAFNLWPRQSLDLGDACNTSAASVFASSLLQSSSLRNSPELPLGSDVPNSRDQRFNSTNDQMLLSADAQQAADLFSFLQHQQQIQDNEEVLRREEQDIDARIDRLLYMKQALQRQKQQGPQEVILEDEPFVPARSASSFTMSSTSSVAMSSGLCSMSLSPSLPLDSNLLAPAPLTTGLDMGGSDWAWATAGSAAAASTAAAARTARRHSVDMGGLAQRMAITGHPAYDMAGFGNYSLAELQPACAALPSLAPVAVAPTAADCGLSSANNIHLQSAFYGLGGQDMAPALPAIHQTASLGAGGLSFDCSSLYGAGAGQQVGGAYPQTGWQAGSSGRRCPNINTNTNSRRRASMDVAHYSSTPEMRPPPRKSASMLSAGSPNSSTASGSARNSPTNNGRQQALPTFGGATVEVTQRGGRSGGVSGKVGEHKGPVHQAPKWAGSHWHPMADVVTSGQIANKGTGVFIPGEGVKASAC